MSALEREETKPSALVIVGASRNSQDRLLTSRQSNFSPTKKKIEVPKAFVTFISIIILLFFFARHNT